MKSHWCEPHAEQWSVHYVTPAAFETLVQHPRQPVLGSFQALEADTMAPTLTRISKVFAGQIRAGQVDVVAYPRLAECFKIRLLPTVLIFEHGLPLEFIVGLTPGRFILEIVSKIVGGRVKAYGGGVSVEDMRLEAPH